jgi:hypothetical protein
MTDPGWTDVTCSFCGRHNRERHMVGLRDDLVICSVCVSKCADVLDGDAGLIAPAGSWSGRWPAKQLSPG